MKKKSKKKVLIFLILIIIILLGIQHFAPKIKEYLHRKKIEKQNIETMDLIKEQDIIKKTTEDITTEIDPIPENKSENEKNDEQLLRPPQIQIDSDQKHNPTQAYLEVQFICQAPLETEENWTYHEESCEEAALLMAYLYKTGQTISKEEANDTIMNMITWQIENFGSHHDIYAEELKEFAVKYYSIPKQNIKIIKDATIDQIKQEIAQGYPVIVPITGQILQNPYYPYPGYHMLIAIGYTEDRIITNDNGTRHGKDFSYDYETFKEAMEDAGGDVMILK